MYEYDILGDYSWDRKTVSYGFNPNVSPEIQGKFRKYAGDITSNTSFTVTEEGGPDVLISFGETQGYLALAHLPGEYEVSGNIILSDELLLQPENYRDNIFAEELAHAVTGILHTQRQDSIMSYNHMGVNVEDVPTEYTPFDYWAMETNNHLV